MRHLIKTLILFLLLLAACGQTPPAPAATAVPAAPESAPTAAAAVPTAAPPTATAEPADAPLPVAGPDGLLVPQGEARETYYAAFPLTMTLDGDAADWAGVPRVALPEGDAPAEPAYEFAAAADNEWLYLLADVRDSNIISGEHGSEYWNEDSVEFYINASGDLSLTRYVPGVSQITIPPLNAGGAVDAPELGGMLFDLEGVQTAVTLTDTGYLVEAAVPLRSNVWDITPGHGFVLGFQSHLNSASQLNRDGKLIWSAKDTADVSYQNPSVFGQLVFYEVGQSEVVAQLPPTPTPTLTPTPLPTPVPVEAGALYQQPDQPIADRVEDLMGRMTLAQKIGQMTLVEKNSLATPGDIATYHLGGLLSGGGGYPAGDNTAAGWAAMVDGFQQIAVDAHLGIPLIYGVDAVHGHNNVYGATIFPHNIGLGAANEPDLMTEIGRITAAEMAATGIYWNYAPAVSVPQDIRWGRTYEGYSEDTDIVTNLAAAYLRGLQGESLNAPHTVAGTPKHFVGDGGTAFGSSLTEGYLLDQGDTRVDEETLRAVHLPPYPAVIDAGARTIMVSFSSWNGVKMHANPELISGVLKEELGFDGFVVSDWAGIDQIDPDYATAVITAINAGIDMNMVPYDYVEFIRVMTEAVESGAIPQERIDDAVRRILTVKMELGLFERPFSTPELLPQLGLDNHRDVARDAVARSLVLLKNDGPAPLPFPADLPTLYVAGAAADNIGLQSGGWTIEWQGGEGPITEGTTILEGIRAAAGPDTEVVYHPRGIFDPPPQGEPVVCLAVVGEKPYAEGQGDSRDLRLPLVEQRTLAALEPVCNQLTVVLVSGRPLIVTDELATWDGLVAAWLPGSEGQGVADVLFGARPFTGTLPYTWPRSIGQLPFDFSNPEALDPLFPRGYGLTAP